MKRITYLGYQIQNELECPLAGYTGRFELIPSTSIRGAVSIIHECVDTCVVGDVVTLVEREATSLLGKTIKHDYKNNYYSINLYSMN